MAKKEEKEIKLNSKEKKKIKDSIIDEIKDDLTIELSKTLVNEVNKSFDDEYKQDLKEKISNEISDDIKNDVRKEERKLSRKKSFKIFRLYLYIIILLTIICFVIYKIYQTDNMNILGLDKIRNPRIVTTPIEEQEAKDLKEKYSSLMDNISISSIDYLNGSFNAESASITDKSVFAYNYLNGDGITVEGSIYTIEGSKMKNAYNKLFNTGDYAGLPFTANGINYKYSVKNDTYIAIVEEVPTKTDIMLEIDSISEDDTYVYIDTIVAVHVGDYIYSKDNLATSVSKYKSNMSLSTYKSKLTTSKFVFEKTSEGNYLYGIY